MEGGLGTLGVLLVDRWWSLPPLVTPFDKGIADRREFLGAQLVQLERLGDVAKLAARFIVPDDHTVVTEPDEEWPARQLEGTERVVILCLDAIPLAECHRVHRY